MAYPRLIFENGILPTAMDHDAVTDLKLDLLFSDEVSRFLTLKPEKTTLLMRREAFAALLADQRTDTVIDALTETLTSAKELYGEMTAAQSEIASSYAFVFLILKIAEFSDLAASLDGYGSLMSRFAAHFKDYSSSAEFTAAISEARSITETLYAVNGFDMKINRDSAKISSASERTVADTLRDCAKELDVPLKNRNAFTFSLAKPVADAVGKVYSNDLSGAVAFTLKYRTLVSGEIFDYLPELKFISGIVSFTREAQSRGIPYCFPALTDAKGVNFRGVYDVTLIKKDVSGIVPNDVVFTPDEPFFYLTGANGGGKTTYLRAVGGALMLFLAGAPVFCHSGEASLLSAVYTHFPRDERFEGTGRFLDEKKRVDAILEKQDGNAAVLLNETFATTGEEKAVIQTGILATELYQSGNFGLYITHQHDVKERSIPFLGVTVDENDRNRRTYRIEKRRLPPRSFAKDILEEYRLDRASLMKRFGLENVGETNR